MALYAYQALSKDGKKVTGNIDATSIQSAREHLVRMHLYPIRIYLAKQTSGWSIGAFLTRGVDAKDKIFFTKQLALLLKSGIPIVQALDLLVEQSEGQLKKIVISLKDAIKEGSSFANALEKFPKVFDNTYVQLVRAGEASGKLEVILNRLTVFLERRQEVTRRVKKALSYPLFQLSFIVIIVGILLTFVIPQIAESFASEGTELPWATQFLMNASDLLRNNYILIFVSIAIIYGLYKWWRNTPRGAYIIDSLKLRIPLVRYFSKMGTVVQFSRTLGMLIEGGVKLSEALFIVGNIVDNQVLAQALNEARENIIKQGRIAEYLKKTNIFPSVAIYLISTGEQSGHLGEMLLTVAEYYETELSDLADNLSSKLGPLMTVLMALIVGFIILAIVMPIMQSGTLAEGL